MLPSIPKTWYVHQFLQTLLQHELISTGNRFADKIHVLIFQEGRTPLHYAAAMCGVPGSDNLCYDILVDNGANEYQVDLEGYTPSNYRQMPRLIDMTQIQGLNRCQCLLSNPLIPFLIKLFSDPMDGGDHIDKMIFDRNIHALQNMVVNGEFDRIEKRIFPPHARDMARILTNLHVKLKKLLFSQHNLFLDEDKSNPSSSCRR